MRSRTIAKLAAIAAAGLTLAVLSTPATAAETPGIANINIYDYNGAFKGVAQWKADGDALRVCDTVADGKGVAALLSYTADNHYASSLGHSSPYCSPWSTGNLTEKRIYALEVAYGTTGNLTWRDGGFVEA